MFLFNDSPSRIVCLLDYNFCVISIHFVKGICSPLVNNQVTVGSFQWHTQLYPCSSWIYVVMYRMNLNRYYLGITKFMKVYTYFLPTFVVHFLFDSWACGFLSSHFQLSKSIFYQNSLSYRVPQILWEMRFLFHINSLDLCALEYH